MNNLSNLTQRWANYFPLYYNARYYEYSSAKLLLNSAADGIDKEIRKIKKHTQDTYPRGSDGFDCDEIFKMELADNTNITSCVVSGIIGSDTSVQTITVHEDIGEFFNHLYFDPPDLFTSLSGEANTWDEFALPTGYYHFIEPSGTLDFQQHNTLNFYCLNVFGNVDIVLGTFKLIRITGRRRGLESEEYVETLYVQYDGAYESAFEWSYVSKIEFLNLKNTIVKIQTGNYNFPMRFLGNMYIREQRLPVPIYAGWEDDHQCFTFCEERITPAAEKVYDPQRLIRITDESGTLLTAINDFQIEKTSRNLIVLNDDKLHYYSTDVEIPTGLAELAVVETCPFNLQFEIHGYDILAVKLQSKYISDTLDCTVVVTLPSGGEYILRSNGQLVAYTGQRDTTSIYTERVLMTLPESGIYKFALVYWDGELYEERRHEMLFNYELKAPDKTFSLGESFTGISQLTKNIYGLYKDNTLKYYRARYLASYYDIEEQQLAIFGMFPLQVTVGSEVITTEIDDMLDAVPIESPFVFIGDV